MITAHLHTFLYNSNKKLSCSSHGPSVLSVCKPLNSFGIGCATNLSPTKSPDSPDVITTFFRRFAAWSGPSWGRSRPFHSSSSLAPLHNSSRYSQGADLPAGCRPCLVSILVAIEMFRDYSVYSEFTHRFTVNEVAYLHKAKCFLGYTATNLSLIVVQRPCKVG